MRFTITARFSGDTATGTLFVRIRQPSAFCEGTVSTTWTAVRQGGTSPTPPPGPGPPPPTPGSVRFSGQTARNQPIALDLDAVGVRRVAFTASVISSALACDGHTTSTSWEYPGVPLVNGEVTLTGVNPEDTVRFRVTARFSGNTASGTLFVHIRQPADGCEGTLTTTWTATRQ